MTTNPFEADLDAIRAEAQKAAWMWDDINDACPYPFATLAGATFKEAFLTARAVMEQTLKDAEA